MTGHTNIRIDDSSPLIDYQPEGAWLQQVGDTEVGSTQYYGSSYTYTQSMGATASFSFNGTSVTIYSAKGVDYGNYSVNIDGATHDGDAFTSSGGPQVPLVNLTSLRQGPHVVTLLNLGYSRLDIDSITWSSDIGLLKGGEYHGDENIVDDISGAFNYRPEEVWWSQSNLSDFMSSTGHTTSTLDASVVYNFSVSETVALYGTTGPQNSPYIVQLDDWPNRTFYANRTLYKSQSLLFYADSLGPGGHILTITNKANSKLQIDYAKLCRLSASRSQPPIPRPTEEDTDKGKGLDPTQIVGIVIGGALIMVLIVSLCILTRRNRTLWNRLQRGYMVQSQFDSSLPSLESGYHVATGSKSSRNGSEVMVQVSQLGPGNSRDMSELQPPALRPLSLVSRMTSSASTLVAEDGSHAGTHRPHRIKGALYQTVGHQTSTIRSPLSPVDNEPSIVLIGQHLTVESSEPDNILVNPEGHSESGSPVIPSRSLAARGRSSPGPTNWDSVQASMPPHRERSPSPVPALSTAVGETRSLIDPGQHTSPSGSTEYLSLAGRKPRRDHGLRSSENYSLFRTRRYI